MAIDIYLDKVVPESGETDSKSKQKDYGKILNRLFQKRSFTMLDPVSNEIVGPLLPQADDRIFLTPGESYPIFTAVSQLSDSPRFLGIRSADREDGGFENTDLIFYMENRSGPALHFMRRTELINITLIDRYPKKRGPEIVRFSGSESGTNLTVGCGSYLIESVAIVCDQPEISLSNCAFSGEGTAVEARGKCRKLVYNSNLNHGDPRAVKILSPQCLVEMQYNTIDIGSQLLWQTGDVLEGSVISYNACHSHRPGMDSLPENGHYIYIEGGVTGLEIVNNVFSGADGIDGDRSNPVQTDNCQFDRPINHIKIKSPEGKKISRLKIAKNQFRFPQSQAIFIAGAIEDSDVNFNNFSGIDISEGATSGIACLLRGESDILNSSFSFNLLESRNAIQADIFNFSNRILDNSKVRGNFVCTPGETYVGIKSLINGSVAKRNFERDDQ